jgi:hypothetical protein
METLEQLNPYSREEFEIWLEGRLRAQYSREPATRYRAFDFRHLGVPLGESHLDQVVGLFKKLSIPAQCCFRDASQQLLRHAQPGDFPPSAMADLVLIMGLIKAYRAFKAFVPVFGNGPWGELHRSLIYDALSVLLMFDRTIESYDAAKGLATSVNFPEAYIFDAYLILVRSRPENWSDDMALLRERFSRLQRRIQASDDPKQIELLARRERDLTKSLVQAIPLSELAKQFVNLRLIPGDARDAWLIDNLFENAAPLRLEYSTDGNSLRLIDRSDNAREMPIPSASEFETFCISGRYLRDHQEIRSSGTRLSKQARALLNNCSAVPRYTTEVGTSEASTEVESISGF